MNHERAAAFAHEILSRQFGRLACWKVTQFRPAVFAHDPIIEGVVRDHVNRNIRRAHLRTVRSDDEAIETIGALRELLELEDLLVPPELPLTWQAP
jgi:hypothetical protein